MKVRWSIVIIFVTLSQACEKITWNPLLNKKHIAVIILARGGSKGIPLKNLSKVGNKTLLNIALIAAYKTKYFDSIWVSTDNTRIYKEALTTGTNVHWRSAASATDTASSIIAVQEFLTFHPEIDVIALIQCTSPFIRVEYTISYFITYTQ